MLTILGHQSLMVRLVCVTSQTDLWDVRLIFISQQESNMHLKTYRRKFGRNMPTFVGRTDGVELSDVE